MNIYSASGETRLYFEHVQNSLNPPQCMGVKVYKNGVSARVALFLGKAVRQKVVLQNGTERDLILSKKSLARYIFSFHKCKACTSPMLRLQKMQSIQRSMHDPKSVQHKAYSYFIHEIEQHLSPYVNTWESPALFDKRISSRIPSIFNRAIEGFLYKVSKNGQKKGYLLGTCHIGTPAMAELNPKIKSAVLKSGAVHIEFSPTFIEKIKLSFSIPQKLQTLFKTLLQACEKVGAAPDHGHEAIIENMCSRANIQIASLETFSISKKTLEKMAECCDAGFDESKKYPEMILKILQSVSKGDWTLLSEYYQDLEQDAKSQPWMDAIFWSRNKNMIQRAAELFEQANSTSRHMVTVGAMHLIGDRGVIAGLQEKGFTISKVKASSD